jgi:hypothetical protein
MVHLKTVGLTGQQAWALTHAAPPQGARGVMTGEERRNPVQIPARLDRNCGGTGLGHWRARGTSGPKEVNHHMREDQMRFLVLLMVLWLASPAGAAEFYVSARRFGGTIIHIDGPIYLGDEKKFAAYTQYDPESTVVQLNSLGGNVVASLEIGRMIWARGYTTWLNNQSVCASACAFIWFSGRHAIVQRYSTLVFHEPYDPETGKPSPVELDNYILAYLQSVGLTAKQARAILYAAPPGPDSGRYATEGWARQLGFEPQIVTSILGGNRACQAKFCLSVP